jgi:hypothetical protein
MIVTAIYPFQRRADPTTLPLTPHAFRPLPLAFIHIDKAANSCTAVWLCGFFVQRQQFIVT